MKFKYVGPLDAVDVPELGVTVERNHQVEASGELAESLAAQPDNWQRVTPPKKTAAKTADKKPATGPAQTTSTEE